MPLLSIAEIAKIRKIKYTDCVSKIQGRTLKPRGVRQKGKVSIGLYDIDEVNAYFIAREEKNLKTSLKKEDTKFSTIEQAVILNRKAGLTVCAIAKRLRINLQTVWDIICANPETTKRKNVN